MLIIALFQLLPLLAIHSRPVSGAPYNPWVEISGTEFDHFPVKRSDSPEYALHAARHALRFKQHEQQKRNYIRNLEDRDHVNEHAEVMRLARESSTDVIAPRENSSGRVGGLRARAPGDDHSQPMADWFSGGVDLMYTAPMYVGSNQQGMDIVPDNFWVPWSKSNMASNHASFDPNNSTTFTETEYKFEQTYGLGKAEGIIGLDTVQMGGFKVQNQIFGVATAVDEQFMRQNNDGIMGFASSKLSKYPATNFFENLIKSQVIAEPYFSVFLTRGRDSQPGKRGIVYGSELCLGCLATVPPELGSVTGDMLMVPLSVWGFWQVAMDGITLNGKTIAGTSGQVILDTGTTLNYLPQAIADAMLSPIGATRHSDGSYTAPVANIDATTRFGFTIGGQRFEMRAEDLVNAFTDETKTEYLLTVAASAITGTQGEPLGILGDSFLKNVISVYHYSYRGVPSVGIQQIALSSGSSSGSADPSAGLPTTTTAIPRPTGRFGETGAGAASATIAASGSVDAGTYAGGGSAVITAKAGAAGTEAAQSSAGVGGSGTGNNGSFKGAGWRRADMGRAMGVVVLVAALMGFLV